MTPLRFAKRRLAALIVFLAVICLCVAVAAQPKPGATTLLQKAATPQTSASTDQTQSTTLPFITKGDSGNGANEGNGTPGITGNATSGQIAPSPNNSSPSSIPTQPATTPATGSCGPCGTYIGPEPQHIVCPMYCVAPVSPISVTPPTTSPSPIPIPQPISGCGTCGASASAPHHACPMYCMY